MTKIYHLLFRNWYLNLYKWHSIYYILKRYHGSWFHADTVASVCIITQYFEKEICIKNHVHFSFAGLSFMLFIIMVCWFMLIVDRKFISWKGKCLVTSEWCHDMVTPFALLAFCEGNPSVAGGSHSRGWGWVVTIMRNFGAVCIVYWNRMKSEVPMPFIMSLRNREMNHKNCVTVNHSYFTEGIGLFIIHILVVILHNCNFSEVVNASLLYSGPHLNVENA